MSFKSSLSAPQAWPAPTIILASASERRRRLLGFLVDRFVCMSADVHETVDPGLDPAANCRAIAALKMAAILPMLPPIGGDRRVVITADTVVAVDDRVFGKPADCGEAATMLRELAGRAHQVHTALEFVVQGPTPAAGRSRTTHLSTTTVWFRPLGEPLLNWYLATGEWAGVAGGYRIQEAGAVLIDRIDGDYSAVVGLPLAPVYDILSSIPGVGLGSSV